MLFRDLIISSIKGIAAEEIFSGRETTYVFQRIYEISISMAREM